MHFQNALTDFHKVRHLLKIDEITLNKGDPTAEAVDRSQMNRVMETEYDPKLTSSPKQALGDFRTIPTSSSADYIVPATPDLEKYQSLEAIMPVSKMTMIHIWDKACCLAAYKTDISNLLGGYELFHQWLDGHMVHVQTAHGLVHNLPLLYLEYLGQSETPDAILTTRFRVDIRLHFIDKDHCISKPFSLKLGSRNVEGDPAAMDSFIFVETPSITKRCIEEKKAIFDEKWKPHLHFEGSAAPSTES